MTIRDAIERYIEWRQAHGAKTGGNSVLLKIFLKGIDGETSCNDVTSGQVCAFLAGNRPLTRYRSAKYSALSGFYRYAISRGYASRSPLPDNEPRRPVSRPPYIYTQDELNRLFGSIEASLQTAVKLDANTFRMLLLLLYGAGLRRGEALRLKVDDVDLREDVLTVRDSKFYKSRIVPVGSQLGNALQSYARLRLKRPLPKAQDSTFLANRDGTPLSVHTVQKFFARVLAASRIPRTDGTRLSPCLHSLRHTFAVNRVTTWYQQGADVQRLLPVLSTYLGHASLAGTQVYLPMTPDLLQQASTRLEEYLRGEENDR